MRGFLQAMSMRRRVVDADRQMRWTQNSEITDFIWLLFVKAVYDFHRQNDLLSGIMAAIEGPPKRGRK
jgi:hypothetical protein